MSSSSSKTPKPIVTLVTLQYFKPRKQKLVREIKRVPKIKPDNFAVLRLRKTRPSKNNILERDTTTYLRPTIAELKPLDPKKTFFKNGRSIKKQNFPEPTLALMFDDSDPIGL